MFGNKIIGIILLILLVIRLLALRNVGLLVMTIGVSLGFIVTSTSINSKLKVDLPDQLENQVLKVYPDMVKTNGASFSYIGKLTGDAHKFVFFMAASRLSNRNASCWNPMSRYCCE
ncbi:hypothetical protein [Lentilactobacillus rapi]|uniref:hypothetical protein n=1 Tax=Lentilactobacillus rapi TaxID=481723 RepID=UPI00272BCE96|nr:hypothetical protein [Lentilactobacillus rapi]